jgi:sugar phosphate isomerase/epimerase
MRLPALLLSLCALLLTACATGPAPTATSQPASPPRPPAAPASDIQLGLQHWTFRRFTFVETLDKARALGLRHLQVYKGQNLGGGLEGKLSHDLDPATLTTIKGWLAERDLLAVSYGVLSPGSIDEWRRIFAFARTLGIRTVATEIDPATLAQVAPLAKAAGVRLALHNHPTPSRYADPAFALETVKPYGPHVGLCADTGHWLRSGLDPVASLRATAPRVLELHLKDVDEPAKNGRDRPFGTGAGDLAGQLAVLRQAGFSGIAFLEYEHDTPQLEKELAACVAYFRAAIAAPLPDLLAGRVAPPGFTLSPAPAALPAPANPAPNWPAPRPLFAPALANAEFDRANWTYTDGVLSSSGKNGYLFTRAPYGDFTLNCEFRLPAGGNSGVFVRTSDLTDPVQNSIEVQLLQGDAPNPAHVVGALFDLVSPTRQRTIQPDAWHQLTVRAIGTAIEVWIDRERVVSAKLEKWTTPGQNPDGTPNKFKKAIATLPQTGRLGFQDHGAPVSFRNIVIE